MRICGLKREKVTRGWRQELKHYSPNIVWMMKLSKMKWAGHVARMGEVIIHTKSYTENMKGRDHLRYFGID